jgi:hypothetical protein
MNGLTGYSGIWKGQDQKVDGGPERRNMHELLRKKKFVSHVTAVRCTHSKGGFQ